MVFEVNYLRKATEKDNSSMDCNADFCIWNAIKRSAFLLNFQNS